jgi:biopolymer transport protein ExbB
MESLLHWIGIDKFFSHLNNFSITILTALLFMSILTWYVIIIKTIQLFLAYWRSRKILNLFWRTDSLLPLMDYLSRKPPRNPFSNLALQSINAAIYYEKRRRERQLRNLCAQSEFLARQMRRAIAEGSTYLEQGLIILATIGSIAPFVGLLGTVVSIYDALIAISARKTASLDTVAAPVGEALIMTALGLAVAIPAVLGYNAILRGNRACLNQLEDFAHDLYTCLNTGARIDMKNRVYVRHHIQPVVVKSEPEV